MKRGQTGENGLGRYEAASTAQGWTSGPAGRRKRGLTAILAGIAVLALPLTLVACKREDVAPEQAKSADALTDAAGSSGGSAGAGSMGAGGPEPAGADANAKMNAGMEGDKGGAAGVPDKPVQEQPEPGKPDQPPPPEKASDGSQPPPSGDEIPMGAPPLPEGVKGVHVKGMVIYPGYKAGHIQIDVADKGSKNGSKGAQPKIIQLYRMEKPGAFDIEVPENQGEIYLSAYNDENRDGKPSREEPRGSASGNPFSVKAAEITGVEIKIEREQIPPPP